VDSLADLDGDLCLAGIGILLAGEGLDMSRTIDSIVNDPGFFGFALAGDPDPLTD
jgi:hypothetical protein